MTQHDYQSWLIKEDEEDEDEEDEESKEEEGVLGFFKKTFTSVKKTFESTFNQPSKRALTRPRSKIATPLVDVRLESPKHKRTTRSITFHVSNEAPSLLQMLLG